MYFIISNNSSNTGRTQRKHRENTGSTQGKHREAEGAHRKNTENIQGKHRDYAIITLGMSVPLKLLLRFIAPK